MFGKNEKNNDTIYIGEAEKMFTRLKQHIRDSEYWNDCIAVISKDNLLNKAHVKYLENKYQINVDDMFDSPINCICQEYSDLVKYNSYSDLSNTLGKESGKVISMTDAGYVLQTNSEYPLSLLEKGRMDEIIKENYKREILDSSEISIKYKGYIEREKQLADKIQRLENLLIPEDFDFDKVESLSIECRQKLKKYSPRTIAQASRISGVSPADISVLLVYFGR